MKIYLQRYFVKNPELLDNIEKIEVNTAEDKIVFHSFPNKRRKTNFGYDGCSRGFLGSARYSLSKIKSFSIEQ